MLYLCGPMKLPFTGYFIEIAGTSNRCKHNYRVLRQMGPQNK